MPSVPLFVKRQGATAEELANMVLGSPSGCSPSEKSLSDSPPSCDGRKTDGFSGTPPSPTEQSQRNRSGYSVRWSSPSVTAHRADSPTPPSFTPPLPQSGLHVEEERNRFRVHSHLQKEGSDSSGRGLKGRKLSPRYQSSGTPELIGPRIVSSSSSSSLISPFNSPFRKRRTSPSPGVDSLPRSRPGSNSTRSQLTSCSGVVGTSLLSGTAGARTIAEERLSPPRQHESGQHITSSPLPFLLSGSNPPQMMQLARGGGGRSSSLFNSVRDGANDSGGRHPSPRSVRLDPRRMVDYLLPAAEGLSRPLSNSGGSSVWNMGEKSSELAGSFFASIAPTGTGNTHDAAGFGRVSGGLSHPLPPSLPLPVQSRLAFQQYNPTKDQCKNSTDDAKQGNNSSSGGSMVGLRKDLIDQLDNFMLAHCARHIPEPQRTTNFRKVLNDLSAATPGLAPLLLNVSRHLKEVIDTLQQVRQSHQEDLAQQEKKLFQKFVSFFEKKIYEILKEKKTAEVNSKRLEEEALELRRSRDEELMAFKREMMIKLNNCEKREEEFQSFRKLIATVFQSNQQLISRTEELEELLRKHRIEFPPLSADIIDVRTSPAADEGRQLLNPKNAEEDGQGEEKEKKGNNSRRCPPSGNFSLPSGVQHKGEMGIESNQYASNGSLFQGRSGVSHRQPLATSVCPGMSSPGNHHYYRNIASQVPISFMKASAEEMSASRLTLQKELLNCAFDERTAYRLEVNKLKSDNAELKQYISKLEETVTDLHRYIHEKRFLTTDDNGEVPLTPRPKEIPFSIQAELGIDLRKHTGEIMSEMGAVSISLKHQLNSALLRLRQMITVTEWMQEDTLVGMDEEINGKGGVLPTVPVSAWSSIPHFLRTHVYPDVPNLKWSESEAAAILYEFFKHYKELRESCWGYRDRKMLRPRILQLFERRSSPLVMLDATPEQLLDGARKEGKGKQEENMLPFGYIVSQFIRHYLMNLAISNANRQQHGGGKPPLHAKENPFFTPGDGEGRDATAVGAATAAGSGRAAVSPVESPGASFSSLFGAGLALPGTLHPTYYNGNAEQVVELEFTRLAYNLWWAANRYSSTQPLCYLFVSIVNGRLPIQVFDAMQQCLSVVASCIKQMDADGSGTFTYLKLMHGVQRMVDDLGVDTGRSAILACVQTFETNHSPLFGGRVSTTALLADESTIEVSGGGVDAKSAPAASGGGDGGGGGRSGSPSKGATQSGGGKGGGQIRQLHTGSLLPPRITATKLPYKSDQPPGASIFFRFWRRLVIWQYELVYSTFEQLLSPLVMESEVVFGLYVLPIPEALHRIQQYDKAPPEWESTVRDLFFPSTTRSTRARNNPQGNSSLRHDEETESSDGEAMAKKVMCPNSLASPAWKSSGRPSDPLSSDARLEGGSEAFASLIREQGRVHQERWTGERERMEKVFQILIQQLPRLNRSVHFPFTAAALKSNTGEGHAVGGMASRARKKGEATATFVPVRESGSSGEGLGGAPDSSLPLPLSSPSSGIFTEQSLHSTSPSVLTSPSAGAKGLHGRSTVVPPSGAGNVAPLSSSVAGEAMGGIKGKKKQKQLTSKSNSRSSFSSSGAIGTGMNNKHANHRTHNGGRHVVSDETHKGKKGYRPIHDRDDEQNIVLKKDGELVEWYSFCHELRQRALPLGGKVFKWSIDPENSSLRTAQWFTPPADEEKKVGEVKNDNEGEVD